MARLVSRGVAFGSIRNSELLAESSAIDDALSSSSHTNPVVASHERDRCFLYLLPAASDLLDESKRGSAACCPDDNLRSIVGWPFMSFLNSSYVILSVRPAHCPRLSLQIFSKSRYSVLLPRRFFKSSKLTNLRFGEPKLENRRNEIHELDNAL